MVVSTSFAAGITPSQTNSDNETTACEGKEIWDFFDLLVCIGAVAQSPTVTDELGHTGAYELGQTDDQASTENSADGNDPSANPLVLPNPVLTLASLATEYPLGAASTQQNILQAESLDRYSSPATAILDHAAVGKIGAGDGFDPNAEALVNDAGRKSEIHTDRSAAVDGVAATGANLRHGEVQNIDRLQASKAGDSKELSQTIGGSPSSPPILAGVPARPVTSPFEISFAAGDGQNEPSQSSTSQRESAHRVTSSSPLELASERAAVESAANAKDGAVLITDSIDSRRRGAAVMESDALDQPSSIDGPIDDGLGKLHGATAELDGGSKRDSNLRAKSATPAAAADSTTMDLKTDPLPVGAASQSSSSGHQAAQFADQSSLKFGDSGIDRQDRSTQHPGQNFPEVTAQFSHRVEAAANERLSAPAWRPVVHQVGHEIVSYLRIGKQEAVIQLDPPELGKIKIDLRLIGDRVEARIITEENSARSLIENHLPELRQALEAGRVDLAEVRVDQQSGGSANGQWTERFHEPPPHAQQQTNGHSGAPSELLMDHAQMANSAATKAGRGRISMWA